MEARRVTVVRGGPVLVQGPVEVALADGTLVRSDRPVVALCACGRSGRLPWCDTSHRRRVRGPDEDTGTSGAAATTAPDLSEPATGAPRQTRPAQPG